MSDTLLLMLLGRQEKNGRVWRDLAIFNHWVGGFALKNYGNTERQFHLWCDEIRRTTSDSVYVKIDAQTEIHAGRMSQEHRATLPTNGDEETIKRYTRASANVANVKRSTDVPDVAKLHKYMLTDVAGWSQTTGRLSDGLTSGRTDSACVCFGNTWL